MGGGEQWTHSDVSEGHQQNKTGVIIKVHLLV